jgi:hypothetical protein
MSGKYSAAKSDYNKDENFASISIDETVKITLSEAIAKDSGDKFITVYGFAELPLVGVDKFGDTNWVFEPQLVKFKIPKLSYESEYNGKKTKVEQSPGMKASLHLITQHGFDTPFSALLDFGMALPVANSVINGKNDKGNDLTAMELEMIGSYFIKLEPIEKLTKLEGIEIKEQSRNGYGAGAKGQKESERLADRMTWLQAQVKPDSELRLLLKAIDPKSTDDSFKITMIHFVETLFY